MARTKETARKTTGGKAPSKAPRAPVEAPKKGKKTLPPPVDSDSSDNSSSSSDESSAVIVAPKKGSKTTKPVAPKKTVVAKPAPKKAAAAKKAAAKKVVGKPSKKAEPVDDSSSESDSQSGSSLGSDSGSDSDDSSSSASPPPTPKKGGRASKKVEAPIVLSDSDSDSGSDDDSGSEASGSDDDSSSSSSAVPPPAPKGRSSKKAEVPVPTKPVKGSAKVETKTSAGTSKVTSETPTPVSYYITQADLFKILFGKNKPDSKTVKALTPNIYVPVETDVVVVKFNSGLGAYFAGRWVFDPKTQAVFAKIENKKGKPTVVPLEKSDAKDLESTNVWSAGKSTYASEKDIVTLLAESVAYHEGLTSGKSTASRGGSEAAEKKAWGDDSSESGDDGVITDPIDRVSAERKRTTTGGSGVKITAETFGKFVSAQKRVESKVDTGAIAREAGISEAESREILLKYKFYESQFPAALTAALVARPPAGRTPAEPAPSRGRDAGSNGGFNQRRSNSAGPAMGGGRQFANSSKRL